MRGRKVFPGQDCSRYVLNRGLCCDMAGLEARSSIAYNIDINCASAGHGYAVLLKLGADVQTELSKRERETSRPFGDP